MRRSVLFFVSLIIAAYLAAVALFARSLYALIAGGTLTGEALSDAALLPLLIVLPATAFAIILALAVSGKRRRKKSPPAQKQDDQKIMRGSKEDREKDTSEKNDDSVSDALKWNLPQVTESIEEPPEVTEEIRDADSEKASEETLDEKDESLLAEDGEQDLSAEDTAAAQGGEADEVPITADDLTDATLPEESGEDAASTGESALEEDAQKQLEGAEEDNELLTRLSHTLVQAAKDERDVSLVMVEMPDGSGSSDEGAILTEAFHQHEIFDTEGGIKAVVKVGMTLDEALYAACNVYNTLSEGGRKCCIGISARGIRLIEAATLLHEAEEALQKAKTDDSPVIAFRADALKYRQQLSTPRAP